jgi:hypothetical protein
MNRNKHAIRYPIYAQEHFFDTIALNLHHLPKKLRKLPFKCLVCGEFAFYRVKGNDLREDCTCWHCHSFNRQRQIGYVLISSVLKRNPIRFSLKSFARQEDLHVYYTESKGPMHDQLVKMKNYVCSEYFGAQYKSGAYIDGIMHQDLQNLSFADSSFDVLISSEVFEHIPDTYQAFKEVYRVLKPGGKHIFTVPFNAQGFKDIIKARLDERGTLQHYGEPEYHNDPIRPESGVLVYQIFSLEMLVKLNDIGFVTCMHHLHSPYLGILGGNAIVFESIKPSAQDCSH